MHRVFQIFLNLYYSNTDISERIIIIFIYNYYYYYYLILFDLILDKNMSYDGANWKVRKHKILYPKSNLLL